MADPRARVGRLVLRGCAWAVGGRAERAELLGGGRRHWHVSVVPRARRRWTRITLVADSVGAATGKLLRAATRA